LQQIKEDLVPVGAPEVESEAALVAVDLDVRRAVVGRDLAEHVAQVVAAARSLDLDHVGPEIPEQHAEIVAVEQHRGLEDPHPLEQLAHWRALDGRTNAEIPMSMERATSASLRYSLIGAPLTGAPMQRHRCPWSEPPPLRFGTRSFAGHVG